MVHFILRKETFALQFSLTLSSIYFMCTDFSRDVSTALIIPQTQRLPPAASLYFFRHKEVSCASISHILATSSVQRAHTFHTRARNRMRQLRGIWRAARSTHYPKTRRASFAGKQQGMRAHSDEVRRPVRICRCLAGHSVSMLLPRCCNIGAPLQRASDVCPTNIAGQASLDAFWGLVALYFALQACP